MSDDFPLNGNLRANQLTAQKTSPTTSHAITGPNAPKTSGAVAGYQSGQEVEKQARVTKPMDGPEFRRALDRLERATDTGKPLRKDVPRGYYLNIRV